MKIYRFVYPDFMTEKIMLNKFGQLVKYWDLLDFEICLN